jgi:hypothetical protein
MPATINGTSGFGGNLTGNVTGNADTSTASTTATKLSTTTGDAPTYACRAWVNFDGTKDTTGATSTSNTNRLIRASGNVTSVLRNSAGNYTLTFTTAMPDANYCLQTTTSGDGATASFVYEANSAASRNTAGVSSVIIQVVSQAGTPADRASNSVAIFR